MLDTMVSSEFIRGSNATLESKILHARPSDISISCISEAEIRFGLAKKPQAANLHRSAEAFLRAVEIQSFDSPAASAYARLRAIYQKEGLSVGSLEALIAAHAHSLGMTLVTRDKALRRLSSWLKIESW
jgi:tRNA(fMet)-specific endonuclease VapC